LNDDLTNKFEFTYKEGKPFLRVLDTGIKRVAASAIPVPKPVVAQPVEEDVEEVVAAEVTPQKDLLGVVFNFNKKGYPRFVLDVIQGEPNERNNGFSAKLKNWISPNM
jgi:non-specific serine/threonine protein kinase